VDRHAGDGLFRAVRERHDSPSEAVLARLGEPLLAIGHRTHLAGQAQLAEVDQVFRQTGGAMIRV
jgi:hypothetical protein